MDDVRFDAFTRGVVTVLPMTSRRHLARLTASIPLLAPLILSATDDTAARKKRKHKHKKKVKRNDFGCVDVGKFCKNDGQCCSGICSGKKGKKTCKAHDSAGCQSNEICGASCGVDCTTSSGDPEGCCLATTGAGFYCMASLACFPCQRDADCTALCGPQAACLACPLCTDEGGTACAGVSVGSCSAML
jgi:hypothetical protein